MSEPRKRRRQFLADLLFAGGAAASAALLARAFADPAQPEPTPVATRTPPPRGCRQDPEPAINGAMEMQPEGKFVIAHPPERSTPTPQPAR
ncbi:hypothetical protein DYH09_34680 [bacterium CPR1]|nr:hypothetical protein [bacterium CPR1]